MTRSGDGWARCRLGHHHWGRFGAAGLLLIRHETALLQLRSRHVLQGGTWSIPGGARDSGETAEETALREAREETGLARRDVEVVCDYVDDHGGWSYTTMLARPLRAIVWRQNYESADLRWVPFTEVPSLPLHSGLRSSWPQLLTLAVSVSATDPG